MAELINAHVGSSQGIRERLLREARGRCCLHRLTWLRTVQQDDRALKFEPLHLHHVVFRSLGGSDEPNNLIPICPTCHVMLHDGRRTRKEFITDDELRELWMLWKHFREAVSILDRAGEGSPMVRVRIIMDVYGLDAAFDLDGSIRYADARAVILQKTVGVLSAIDPHFPFARGPVEPVQWHLSSDRLAREGQWMIQGASEVFNVSAQPLRLEAPVIYALAQDASWVYSTRPQHRGL